MITQDNFAEYFRNIRENKPQQGDIMARYTAMAELSDGHIKESLINLLFRSSSTEAAIQTMRKLAHATEKDAIRVCKEICKDLVIYLPEEVKKRVYSYQLELFYYTKKEYVPIDDPHWSLISIANLDEFLDISGNKLKLTAKLVTKEDHEKS